MLLHSLSCWLILGMLNGISACPDLSNNTLDARWYGVGNPTGDEPKTNNAWPVTKEGVQPVRYCWVKQTDKDNLQTILTKAIGKWDWAIQNSALQIIPDQADGPNICGGKGVGDDALQIEDITSPGSISAGLTTQGYWYHGLEEHVQGARHSMKFFVEYPNVARQNPHPHDVLIMAHELGHAIGLEHEHARPDAADHLWFYCENLHDYEAVRAKIQAPDTIEEACKSREMARKYQFSAWAYLPRLEQGQIGQNAWSIQFDQDSIMIYGSYDGGKDAPPSDRSLGKPVLLGHPEGEKNPNAGKRHKIYMGGASSAAQAGVSMGDTARVAQLYPPQDPEDADTAGANEPEWKGPSKGVAKRGVKTSAP